MSERRNVASLLLASLLARESEEDAVTQLAHALDLAEEQGRELERLGQEKRWNERIKLLEQRTYRAHMVLLGAEDEIIRDGEVKDITGEKL